MSQIRAVLNGATIEREVEDHVLLIDFLREEMGLTGVKRSCEVQVCGACTVLVDGKPISSCCYLAVDVVGTSVETIEGVVGTEFFERASDAFMRHAAVQCGFCTPGFVLTLKWLDAENRVSDPEDLKEELRGNLCRCTGYKGVLEAAEVTLRPR